KLFRNKTAAPGLRVRLIAAPQNPWAIGTVVRIVSDGHYGPAREIHAGSGYWSQDSTVQVLARPSTKLSQLWVRWPGGRTNLVEIPVTAREISFNSDG